MSVCRSKTYRDVENKLSSVDKLQYTNTIDSNKIPNTKDKQKSIIDIVSPDINSQSLMNNNISHNKIILEEVPKKKSFYNHDNSTMDHNDINKEMIRESDIVFEIIDKKDNQEEDSLACRSSIAKKKWGVILNVFKVINNMKSINTKNVRNLTELDRTIELFEKTYPKGGKNAAGIIIKRDKDDDHFFQGNFEEITKQIKFFEYISSGEEEHIEEIISMIKNDPVRNLYDESDKHKYFVNQPNIEGFTALYITCMNGQLKLAQILIKFSADHLQKCGNNHEEQSVLEVAIRWGHIKLVEYLLTLKWPMIFLKNGLKQALERKNEQIIKMIRKAIGESKAPTHKKSCSCFG